MPEAHAADGKGGFAKGLTGAIAKRAAASLAATAAGAATTYALRHGPKLLREQVLPKLRERGRSADGGLPTRAATSSRTQTGGAAERRRRAQRRGERQRVLEQASTR